MLPGCRGEQGPHQEQSLEEKDMPQPAVRRSLGAPSAVSSPGAAWQDGGAKPAAAELWVSLPVSWGLGTGLRQPTGTQGPELWPDPGSIR